MERKEHTLPLHLGEMPDPQRTRGEVLLPDGPPQAVLPRFHLPADHWGKEGPASLLLSTQL